jgi:hypothetical protein
MMRKKKKVIREPLNFDDLPKWQQPFCGMPHLREPRVETEDYPNMVVHDGRVTGSITAGYSRLPLWCLIPDLVYAGFPYLQEQREDLHGLTAESFSNFLYYLLEHRGDFGRLLCVLADVERQTAEMEKRGELDSVAWWYHPKMSQRVRDALKRCIESLEA